MEQQLVHKSERRENAPVSFRLWELRNAVDRYLIEREVGHFCHVTVSLKGKWFEFEGIVDCQWTRAVLFSLVPPEKGKRHIVDKLEIVDAPLTKVVLS